ncbi:MAG: short chain dehydrogenase [Ilumatobacteraceae bacterium]|nr:short chain dehydrogenase [Ilumatobacteraceae bacterium]
MGWFDGRSGLVTGAASGIGRASALAFAAEGANVVVADVDTEGGAQTVSQIQAAGGTASFLRCDVRDEAQVEALVAAVVERHGRLDWAHNNAGLSAPVAAIADQQSEWWDLVLGVNLMGVMFSIKHEVRTMIAQGGGGSIVITASTAGLAGIPGMSQYSASKWALIGLTKTAALENAPHGIRVNAICPGMTATPGVAAWADASPEMAREREAMIPLGRMAQPDEQAKAAVWLCSDQASYITGVALPVDGGSHAG